MKSVIFEKTVTGVLATGDTDLIVIGNREYAKLCVHLAVTGQALDNFDVLAKANPAGVIVNVTPANWASLADTDYPGILYASGNLAALAAAASGYFEMDVTGLREITLRASAAVDGAAVALACSLSR
jgi:hypothetical protein